MSTLRRRGISKWRIAAMAASMASIVGLSFARPAEAFTYGMEFMTSYSGCDSPCSSNSGLSQTDDQMNMMDSTLSGLGHTFRFKWSNGNTFASDLAEDRDYSGDDWNWADGSDIFAYSGHGSGNNDGNGQSYQMPLCRANGTASCNFDSDAARWGEGWQFNFYYSTHPGAMRWAVLATCFSVDVDPWNQWAEGFTLGLEYVLGYRGLSADSFTTDEVPSDWANSCIGNTTGFKSGWFSAAEDLWVDDTAEVAAGGTDVNDAIYNRDNQIKTWSKKPVFEEDWWAACAWQSV